MQGNEIVAAIMKQAKNYAASIKEAKAAKKAAEGDACTCRHQPVFVHLL